MIRRRFSALPIGAVASLAAGLVLTGCGGHNPTVRTGVEIVLQAVPADGGRVRSSDLDTAVSIMKRRLKSLGVPDPQVRKEGENQIVIRLPGARNPTTAAKIIGQTGRLELYDLENDLQSPSIDAQGNAVAHASLFELLSPVQTQAKKGTPSAYALFTRKHRLVSAPLTRRPKAAAGEQILAVPHGMVVLSCGGTTPPPVICPGGGEPTAVNVYLFRHTPELTGKDLNPSGVKQDFDASGNPIVLLSFTSTGDHAFQSMTRTLYQRGRLRRSPQHFAIALNDVINSFPQIDYTDSTLSDGITGGGEITGVTLIEAQNLALVLKYGALPVSFTLVKGRVIG
jgi:protein-export membrane protein SecD